MLNKEKYKDELEEVLAKGLAVLKSGEILRCRDLKYCNECIFFGGICVNSAMDWLNSEYKEPILTEEEREYLSAVIKPFRNEVLNIKKKSNYLAWISIVMKDQEIIKLPFFEKSSEMYKGMELGKEYTLEELGL